MSGLPSSSLQCQRLPTSQWGFPPGAGGYRLSVLSALAGEEKTERRVSHHGAGGCSAHGELGSLRGGRFLPAGTRDPMPAFLWEPMQGRVLWGNSCIWRSWPWCPTQRVYVDMCSPGVLQGLDLPFHWAHRISGCENICRDHFVTGPTEVLRLMADSRHFPGCHLPCTLWPCLPSISSGTAALMRVARPRPRTLELHHML